MRSRRNEWRTIECTGGGQGREIDAAIAEDVLEPGLEAGGLDTE